MTHDLLKETNKEFLPKWLKSKMVYKSMYTYLLIKNKLPTRGESRGMGVPNERSEKYDQHALKYGDWILRKQNGDFLILNNANLLNNYVKDRTEMA